MNHMKTLLMVLAVCISVSISGCGNRVEKPSNAVSNTAATIEDGDYYGKGKVTKIDMNIGSVAMDHDDIPGLMPAMSMEFYVSDKAMLSPLTVGDSVDFTVFYKGGTETITKIEKSK
jgi:Cu/Ag efflux protein CusF